MPALTQVQAQRASRKLTKTVTLSAPLKGWNTRDPFEAMDPLDAIILDNWYPDYAGLVTRNGYVGALTLPSTSAVQTLAEFRTATFGHLLAACGGSVYRIDPATGAVTSLASGFTQNAWQTVTFNKHQFWVNGTNTAQIYDGATLAATGFSGVTTSTLLGVAAIHSRLFFWTGSDPSFWYGGVNSITGVLTNFPLSTVSEAGGDLLAVEILSYDGGNGIGAYTCFFMSSGEVLLYSGTDPSNPSNWALVGRYMIPPPITVRGIARYGGDIYITTATDHFQFSKLLIALKMGEVPPKSKASGAAHQAYANGYSGGVPLPGWQAFYYANGNRMIYNIPALDGTFTQHIYNNSTQVWCRFRGMKAYHWATFKGTLYFGGANGIVYQADTGSTDAGVPILAQGQQAWNTFGTPLIKRISAVRPAVQSQGIADFNFGLGFDYQPANIAIPDSTISNSDTLIWGATNWGSPRVWGGTGVTDPRWHVGGGNGAAIGLSLAANTRVSATWIRTDLLIEPGVNL